MLVKFWWNHMVQIIQNFKGFLNHFWQSVDVILEKVPEAETIVSC